MPLVVGDLDPREKRVMVVGVGRRRGERLRREREIWDGGERMVEEKEVKKWGLMVAIVKEDGRIEFCTHAERKKKKGRRECGVFTTMPCFKVEKSRLPMMSVLCLFSCVQLSFLNLKY